MLNHNQAAIVLMIGLVAVLMTLSSTRVFAQPTLPPGREETPADQHHPIENLETAAFFLPKTAAQHHNVP
jgi:hypothetical protein